MTQIRSEMRFANFFSRLVIGVMEVLDLEEASLCVCMREWNEWARLDWVSTSISQPNCDWFMEMQVI